MRRLVESWIKAEEEQHGNSLAKAIARMNERHGVRLTHSRVAEWRRGVYVPSQVMLSEMLNRVLPWALLQAGIDASNDQLRALKECLWVTEEKDGRRYVELV
ncbi:MAG TPA: hypothetical protein VKA63_01600 [Candidatus Krumholzibacteria bacterium]|nr:hypothetical protein [Candidatus Krumholzibacteria bacterium]